MILNRLAPRIKIVQALNFANAFRWRNRRYRMWYRSGKFFFP